MFIFKNLPITKGNKKWMKVALGVGKANGKGLKITILQKKVNLSSVERRDARNTIKRRE